MKLVLLHLSDMHFRSNGSFTKTNVDNIVASLRQHCIGATGIIVIVSGDLTLCGYYIQALQVKKFLSQLVEAIQKKYHFDDVHVLAVPGNHDVNLKVGNLSSGELFNIHKKSIYQQRIDDELRKEKNGIDICQKYGCFVDGDLLVSVKYIAYENISIRFNLINTAPFSLSDQDKGFHYLSDESINKLFESSDTQFTFTIMHHPYQFFEWETYNKLEEILLSGSDAIFVGHEHYAKYRALSGEKASVNIYAAGMLCNAGNWDKSEFFISTLDTDTREYSLNEYKWDTTGKIYIGAEKGTYKLGSSRLNSLGLQVKEEYKAKLLADLKYEISSNLLDYYVFPLIEEQSPKTYEHGEEISDSNRFLERLSQNKKVFLLGNMGSGKTITGKYVFEYFSEKKAVLFVNGSDIRDNHFDRFIKNQFEETFSNSTADYEKFLQAEKNKKAIIVDDIHLVSEHLHQELFRYLEEQFDIILVMSQVEIELDIFERLRQRSFTENYLCYRIRSFYADKRKILVQKITNILIQQEETRVRQANQICDALEKHKYPFIWNAEFVTQFTKYSCDNIGISTTNDGDTFSKVFEHSLTSLLKPHVGKMKIDKFFFILGKIAYEIHTSPVDNKKYPILMEDICAVIRRYNSDYNSDVDPIFFVGAVVSARILKKYENGYIFTERNYLAYFVAREIKQRIHVYRDDKEFQKALDYACFGINADVILFVTYISDNPTIVKWIMDKANEYVERWEEFTLSPVRIPYLSDVDQLKVLPVTENDRIEHEQQIVENEKKVEKSNSLINPAEVYSYEEGELKLIDEMIRSISTMVILSRTLPSFEYFLEGQDKRRCVALIYSLPLRIFNIWALEIERNKANLVSEIKEMLELHQFEEKEYRRSKHQITDNDALALLRSESVLLLLELMNCAMRNATRPDTFRYINDYPYTDRMTYRIEHLMAQDSMDNPEMFYNEAIHLSKDTKAHLESILVKHITRHYMVTSKRLDQRKRQMLNAGIFNGELKNRKILLEQAKNKKR